VQYKWIAHDVVPTEQEQPYDLDDEQAETDRTQDHDTLQNTNVVSDGDHLDNELNAETSNAADENEDNDENQLFNDEIQGAEQFEEEG
ncbi:unnamed protein product, partial [Rotaria sp. Silwood1]